MSSLSGRIKEFSQVARRTAQRMLDGKGSVSGPTKSDVEEFVDWCYQSILGRAPDPEGRKWCIESILGGRSRLDVVMQFIESPEARSIDEASKFVPPGHFYSPLLSKTDIYSHLARGPNGLGGVDLRVDAQRAFLEELAPLYSSLPFTADRQPGLRYAYQNSTYSYSDAIFLASMIRHAKPKRIIEVGSGNSSCVILDVNEHFFESGIRCTFIDPYPDYLLSLLSEPEQRSIDLVRSRLQDVPSRRSVSSARRTSFSSTPRTCQSSAAM